MLGALNAHIRKIYFVNINIITGFLNVLNRLKEPLMQLQNLENSISRDFGSEIYILSLTMETIVALK